MFSPRFPYRVSISLSVQNLHQQLNTQRLTQKMFKLRAIRLHLPLTQTRTFTAKVRPPVTGPRSKFRYPHKPRSKTHDLNSPEPEPKPELKKIPFLDELKQLDDPIQGFTLFDHYANKGFNHDYPSYNCLIYKLARSRNFLAVDRVLNVVKHRNIRCRESLFIGLMQHYGKCGLVEKAVSLFNGILRFNCGRTIVSFNTLLNVLVDNRRYSDADKLLRRGREMCFRLNSVSYNVVMKGWLARGDLGSAWMVFEEMLERGVEPSVVSFNGFIGFLVRKGEVEKAMKLFDGMIEKRMHPNAVTYGLLMEGLCSLGKFDAAKKMLFDMEYRGCKPTVANLGVLMTALARKGKLEEAKSFAFEMAMKKNLEADVVMYNILVNFLCKEGRVDEAYKVLVDMQMNGCKPNAATYRTLVDGYCRVGEYVRGLSILNAMLTSGHCARLETFHRLVSGLVKGRKFDEAVFLLEEMEKKNLSCEIAVWESLIGDLCFVGNETKALVSELISFPSVLHRLNR